MKNKLHFTSTSVLIMFFSVILSSYAVHATIITTTPSQSSVYVAPGINLNQSFNINGLLTEDLYTSPYDITSAAVTFTFGDEDDPYFFYNRTNVTNASGTSEVITNYFREESENAEITTPTGQTTSYANTSPITRTRQYVRRSRYLISERYRTESYDVRVSSLGCGFLWLQPCYETRSRRVLVSKDYKYESFFNENLSDPDLFSFTWQLDATSLADLISDGIIDYEINSTFGDFIFTSTAVRLNNFKHSITSCTYKRSTAK